MSEYFYEILEKRYSRRSLLKFISLSAIGLIASKIPFSVKAETSTSLTFEEVPHKMVNGLEISKGYRADVLIRWGDGIIAGTEDFTAQNFTKEKQEKSFGYNNDFIAFMPLPLGSENSENGLLCVNHEYANSELMFEDSKEITKEMADIILAAHGHSVVEIKKNNDKWEVVKDSAYNRRFTGFSNFAMSGEAVRSSRLKTSYDPELKQVTGTLNNCAGGKTPWGTVLICEENFDGYFSGDFSKSKEARNYARYFKSSGSYDLAKHYDRFNLEKEPNEPNRFGWVVEIDPYNPASTPVKRTSLGRFKHEAATTALCPDGRVAVYSGDDQQFEYVYKFISKNKYDPNNRNNNLNLLDEGTLFVAKFDISGKVKWLPLVHGTSGLDEESGFNHQGHVVIEARRAGDIVGATKMDRPEDVETNPLTGSVFVVLTNNTKRKEADAANPRAPNHHGHIIEMIPPKVNGVADHASEEFDWEIFLKAGDPNNQKDMAKYHNSVSKDGWLSCPDNIAFDKKGRMWIATDGQDKLNISDAVYACATTGEKKALTKHFLNAPRGAEVCGPEFTPDGKTFFVAIQHPGEEKGSTFKNPITRWPDFRNDMPPRPSVVAITKDDGTEIGG